MIVATTTDDGKGLGNQILDIMYARLDPEKKIHWTIDLWAAAVSDELKKYNASWTVTKPGPGRMFVGEIVFADDSLFTFFMLSAKKRE